MPDSRTLICAIQRALAKTITALVVGISLTQANAQTTHDAAEKADLAIAGSTVSDRSSYSYAGLIKPIFGGAVGQGWFGQVTASYLTYRYSAIVSALPQTIKASAPGIDVGAGYAWLASGDSLVLSTSLGYRNIRLNPNDPGNSAQGKITTMTPQLQAHRAITEELDSDLIANYAFGQRSSFARLRLGWRSSPQQVRIGLEETHQRGITYRMQQTGIFIDQNLAAGLALQLSTGVVRQRGQSDSPYVSLSLSRFF